MKANELMICDLVHCITDNTTHRILRLNLEDDYRKDGELYKNEENKLNYLFDVEPIPLTEEILKANGFRKVREYEWEDDIFVSIYRFNSDDLEYWFEMNFTPSYDGFTWKGCDVNNVHQLQRALRFVGLNDLADNFKIK